MPLGQELPRTGYNCPKCSGKLLMEVYTFECRDCGYVPYKPTA